jgi:hypothetical protein
MVALCFAPEIRQFGYRFDGDRGEAEDLAAAITALSPAMASAIPRGKPCPCGSGLRFKSCHGAPGKLAPVASS